MMKTKIRITTTAFALGAILTLATAASGQEKADDQMIVSTWPVPPTVLNLLFCGHPPEKGKTGEIIEIPPIITAFRNAGIELVDGSTAKYDFANSQLNVKSNQTGIEQVDHFLSHLGWKLVHRRDYKGNKLFAVLDDNGNGKIDKAEIEKATELLHALDENADGEISGDELLPNESQ